MGGIRRPASPGWRGPVRLLRWAGWTLLALLLGLLLLLAAWVLSNLRDAEPRPRPPELALPPERVPDAHNAAYALMGAAAAPGRNPAAVGRALWAAETAWATRHPAPAQRLAALDAHQRELAALAGPLLAHAMHGAPADCGDAPGCFARWMAAHTALAAQRAPLQGFGQRCEALSGPDPGFESTFDEPVQPALAATGPVMGMQTAVSCSRWLRSGAAIAAARGRRDEALRLLLQADRLWRGLLAGSRTLVVWVVSQRLAADTLADIAELALRRPDWAGELAPMLAQAPDWRSLATSWMATEAEIARVAMRDAADQCLTLGDLESIPPQPWAVRLVQHAEGWLCRHRIGWQPERTEQRADAAWLARRAAVQRAWAQATPPADIPAPAPPADGLGLKWRNTLGAMLVDAAQGTVNDTYSGYSLRLVDTALRHEAVQQLLALQQAGVPAAERAAWWQRQPLSGALRAQSAWGDDGRTITVRSLAFPAAASRHLSLIWPP